MNSALRILDANLNRAREGLRVVEEYVRFAIDDATLSASLKSIRHDFSQQTSSLAQRALSSRDASGDVGTSIKTESEQTRADLRSIAIASCKRVGEALRAIEEYAKPIDPAVSRGVESIRYRFYDLERDLLLLRRFRGSLYLILTESICKRPWDEALELALCGGVDVVQLREKTLGARTLITRAKTIRGLCDRFGATFIVNDRPDIALLAHADGVHVGQDDLAAHDARTIVGERKLVGVSTHSLDDATRAQLDGADYVGVGPVFPSTTKPRDFVAGIDVARRVASSINIPAVAIAGISLDNVDQLVDSGIRSIAVGSAILSSDDPESAARSFRAKLKSE